MKLLERVAKFLKMHQSTSNSSEDYILNTIKIFREMIKSEQAQTYDTPEIQKANKEIYSFIEFYTPLHGRTDNDAFVEGGAIFSVFPEDGIAAFDIKLKAAENLYAKDEFVHLDGELPITASSEEFAKAAYDTFIEALNSIETDVTLAPFDIRMHDNLDNNYTNKY